jgi:hypothetical protein
MGREYAMKASRSTTWTNEKQTKFVPCQAGFCVFCIEGTYVSTPAV